MRNSFERFLDKFFTGVIGALGLIAYTGFMYVGFGMMRGLVFRALGEGHVIAAILFLFPAIWVIKEAYCGFQRTLQDMGYIPKW